MTMCVLLILVLGKSHLFEGNLHVIAQHLLFLQNLFYERDAWFYGVSWSLAVEEWFYILSPLILYLCCRMFAQTGNKYFTLVAILLILFLPTLCRYLAYEGLEKWGGDLRAVVIYRLDSIGYGLLGSWLLRYTEFFKFYRRIQFALGCICLFVAYLWVNCGVGELDLPERGIFSGVFVFSITSIGALLCIPALRTIHTCGYSYLDKFIYNTSVWSYSMYLYHGFCILFVGIISNKFMPTSIRGHNYFFPVALVGASIVLSYLVSWLLYEFFEIRMTKYLRNKFSSKEKNFV